MRFMSGRPNLSCMMRRHFCHHVAVSYNLCQMRVHLFVYTFVFTFATTWQYGTTYASCRFVFFFWYFLFYFGHHVAVSDYMCPLQVPFLLKFFFFNFWPPSGCILHNMTAAGFLALSPPLSPPPSLSLSLSPARASTLCRASVSHFIHLFIHFFISRSTREAFTHVTSRVSS